MKSFVILCLVVTSVVGVLFSPTASGQCRDELLLENDVEIIDYGIDTTGHWWARARTTSVLTTLYIDGTAYGPFMKVDVPMFSRDGSAWAVSVDMNGIRGLQTSGGYINMSGVTNVRPVLAPQSSGDVWWIVENESERTLTNGSRSYRCVDPTTMFAADPSGTVIVYVGRRGNQYAIVRNGVDLAAYDEVILGGVWSDGRIVAAVRNGAVWDVLLGDDVIANGLISVRDLTVNAFGTVLAFVGGQRGAPPVVTMMTDEYREPWQSPPLESPGRLVLSPCCDLTAIPAVRPGARRVMMYGSAEYPVGNQHGPPSFSYDGGQMVYAGDDAGAFVAVNGKRYVLRGGGVAMSTPLVVSPSGSMVAWPSSSTIVTYDVELQRMQLGKMCDTMGNVVYDWRTRSAVGLGLFGGRLYKLICPLR